MIQPCIKFIAYTSSYIILVGLVVISSLSFPINDLDDYHFKDHYPVQYPNYTAYIENVNLTYRFEANDFVIRKNKPNTIDCFICIWLIGEHYTFKCCWLFFLFYPQKYLIFYTFDALPSFGRL
jgi:hypothetical protein